MGGGKAASLKVVIDCNVVVSAARPPDGACRQAIVEAVRQHEIVLSSPIVAEYRAVAERRKHAAYRSGLRDIIEELERVAVVVVPARTIFGLSDPDDEIYLATALAANAMLVTGNRRDFTQPRYGSVEVLSARGFLERVR